MSVNTVSGHAPRQDLVSALRQARAASVQPVDASGYSTASQDAGTAQGTGSAAPTSNAATPPAMSSDLMASLLQLQSDFSQMGLQNGVTSAADSDKTSSKSSVTDASQALSGTNPVHHRHDHHVRQPGADEAGDTETGSASAKANATSDPGTAPSAAGLGDGLQTLFQQMTKAIAAYATTGPAGIAASVLTSSTKA